MEVEEGWWLVPGRAQKAAGRIITFSGLSRLDAAGQSFHKWKAPRSDEILRRAGDQYFRLAWWAVTVGDLLASSQRKKRKLRVGREALLLLPPLLLTSAVGTKFKSKTSFRP